MQQKIILLLPRLNSVGTKDKLFFFLSFLLPLSALSNLFFQDKNTLTLFRW
jgi:hypothetical protein